MYSRYYESLYREVVRSAPLEQPSIFVELGSTKQSTAFMSSQIIISGKPISLYSVRGTSSESELKVINASHCEEKVCSVYSDAPKGLRNAVLLESDFACAATMFATRGVDCLCIHGIVDYLRMRNIIHAWKSKIKRNGVLAGWSADSPQIVAAIQNQLPWSQVAIRESVPSDQSWSYRQGQQPGGAWLNKVNFKAGLPRHMVTIPCVTGGERLNKAVLSILRSDVNITVLDASQTGLDLFRFEWCGMVNIYKGERGFSFPQAQNFAQWIAKENECEINCVMHDDAYCVDADAVKDFIEYSANAFRERSALACIFTQYDGLCAHSVLRTEDVGAWDETFLWYHSDIDYFDRVALAGLHTEDWPEKWRIVHEGSGSLKDDPMFAKHASATNPWAKSHLDHKWSSYRERKVPYNFDATP